MWDLETGALICTFNCKGRVDCAAVAPDRRTVVAGDVVGREAEKHWRRLDGSRLIVKVLRGVRFIDGEEQADDRLAA